MHLTFDLPKQLIFIKFVQTNLDPSLASLNTQLFASQEGWLLLTLWQEYEDANSQVLSLSLHKVEVINAELS